MYDIETLFYTCLPFHCPWIWGWQLKQLVLIRLDYAQFAFLDLPQHWRCCPEASLLCCSRCRWPCWWGPCRCPPQLDSCWWTPPIPKTYKVGGDFSMEVVQPDMSSQSGPFPGPGSLSLCWGAEHTASWLPILKTPQKSKLKHLRSGTRDVIVKVYVSNVCSTTSR